MVLIGITGILKRISLHLCQQKKKKKIHPYKLLANKVRCIQLAISHVHVAFITGKFQ